MMMSYQNTILFTSSIIFEVVVTICIILRNILLYFESNPSLFDTTKYFFLRSDSRINYTWFDNTIPPYIQQNKKSISILFGLFDPTSHGPLSILILIVGFGIRPSQKITRSLFLGRPPKQQQSGVGGGRRKETQESRICNNKFNHDDVTLATSMVWYSLV